jgi:hypothetical protein
MDSDDVDVIYIYIMYDKIDCIYYIVIGFEKAGWGRLFSNVQVKTSQKSRGT